MPGCQRIPRTATTSNAPSSRWKRAQRPVPRPGCRRGSRGRRTAAAPGPATRRRPTAPLSSSPSPRPRRPEDRQRPVEVSRLLQPPRVVDAPGHALRWRWRWRCRGSRRLRCFPEQRRHQPVHQLLQAGAVVPCPSVPLLNRHRRCRRHRVLLHTLVFLPSVGFRPSVAACRARPVRFPPLGLANRLSSRAPKPRPTAFRTNTSHVAGQRAAARAAAPRPRPQPSAACAAAGTRRSRTATPLTFGIQFLDVHFHLLVCCCPHRHPEHGS